MRVSLVSSVEFVAKVCYGLNSLEGVRVNIWGDGMQRGKQDVTRMCFTIVGSADAVFNCQSRNETFTFASFYGKDTRVNMEINLASFSTVGERGWLYEVGFLISKIFSNTNFIVKLS